MSEKGAIGASVEVFRDLKRKFVFKNIVSDMSPTDYMSVLNTYL